MTFGASKKYGDHWRYGADVKGAYSFLNAGAAAAAVLVDVGINYNDTVSGWDFGAVAKNMGSMVKDYTTGNQEPVPFDLQLGVYKTLKHVPLRLFMTVHHLYEWDIRYDDPNLITPTNILGTADTAKKNASYFGDKLMRHLIFGAELSLAKKLTITVSYNDLQREELSISDKPGMAGFALGIGLHLKTIDIHYARTYYHIAGPYNEIGFNLALNRMFGLGQWGEKVGWNKEYEDWD